MEGLTLKELRSAYRRFKKKNLRVWVQARNIQPGNLEEPYLFIVVWQILHRIKPFGVDWIIRSIFALYITWEMRPAFSSLFSSAGFPILNWRRRNRQINEEISEPEGNSCHQSDKPIYKWGQEGPEKRSKELPVLSIEADSRLALCLGFLPLDSLPYLISQPQQTAGKSHWHTLEFSFPKLAFWKNEFSDLSWQWALVIPSLLSHSWWRHLWILTHLPLVLIKKRCFSYPRIPLIYHNSPSHSCFSTWLK